MCDGFDSSRYSPPIEIGQQVDAREVSRSVTKMNLQLWASCNNDESATLCGGQIRGGPKAFKESFLKIAVVEGVRFELRCKGGTTPIYERGG